MGTADCTYSNFQQFRFAVGSIGFMKGEQFFHVAKALLCKDLPTAVQMMITTGGPPLRRLGHEVSNYAEFGAEWEDVDSGLVLFVNTVIKLAALQPCFSAANDILHQEFKYDGPRKMYIAEGAKDDVRCGIGIHADDPTILQVMDSWGRNQLGHACMLVSRYLETKSYHHTDSILTSPVGDD